MAKLTKDEIELRLHTFITERKILPQLGPSTRDAAAEEIGVSRGEIDAAVNALYHQGLITTGPGEGLGLREKL